ncbi:MAG: M1 family metallopeptidase, partial [Gammaproteobacteria bacterium]|nr:M1 family metallopeptidase [Gammaproteobacteria bacterium]
TNHDIENAFDGITYSKGGAVLSMFERYLGEESFRDAMRFHLRQFAHRNADVNDFIDSVVRTGGDQVGDAFRSFLFQPGIPMLAMNLDCSTTPTVTIGQTKFKPIGSEAKATQGWMVPVCMRYGNNDEQHESCKLVGPETTTLPLSMDHCPTWFLPNADFAGYFHWVMPASAYPGLIAAEAHLSAIEQMSIVDSINAALAAGSMSVGDAATLLEMIAKSERPQVALAAKNFIEYTRDYLVVGEETRNGLVAYVEKLYGDLPAVEAFKPDYMKELPSDSLRLFLVDVAELQAWSQDEAVRNTATHRARQWIAGHEDSLAPSSIELALRVAIADTGEEAIAPLLERFENSRDGHERKAILAAIARVTDPKLAARVRNMALGKSLRVNEIRGFLINHIKELANRPATWVWLQQNFDALISRLPPRDAGRLPAEIAGRLCDETVATEVEAYLAPRMSDLTGGPRNIAKAVETIRLCARRAEVQRPQADEFF